MKVVITGGTGFLGWHTTCRLAARNQVVPVRLDRAAFADPQRLGAAVADADVVFHLAGVNRDQSGHEIERRNIELAEALGVALRRSGRPVRVVYANSIQAGLESPYGRGKAAAADILAGAVAAVGGSMADVRLPNLFGEHGRPQYNSFVATFCDVVARGGAPLVLEDREVPLVHAQAAASALIDASSPGREGAFSPRPTRVSEVAERLLSMHDLYMVGEIPPLPDQFSIDLFNTYRSYTFPTTFPRYPTPHRDARGLLLETSRSHGGTSQTFVSTTAPGQTRGEHYHLHKIERFVVVKGSARIELRRLFHNQVVTFELSGDHPGFVDMPTMWAHNITNVGDDELVTMFWADQLLDPHNPDQYPERVRVEALL